MSPNDYNLALKVEFADRYVSLKRVDLLEIIESGTSELTFRHARSATILEDGSIVWADDVCVPLDWKMVGHTLLHSAPI